MISEPSSTEDMDLSTLKEELLDPGGLDEVIDLLLKHSFSPGSYQTLGLKLGISPEVLEQIKKQHSGNDKRCLSQCLAFWLKSASSPTIFTLIKALQEMGEDSVAERIHKEKHPACLILLQYEEQIINHVLKGHLFLHKNGLLSTMIFSTSPTEREQAIMKSVKESVCLNHHNLEKLARILQMMDDAEMTGSKVLEEYRQKYVTPGYWVTLRPGAGVQLHVTKRIVMEPLETIRRKRDDVIVDAIQAMKDIPSIKDLKRFINLSEPTLQKEIESCQTNGDILELVRNKCSVSDITPMESIITQFKVDDVKATIQGYKASLLEFYEKIPLHNCIHSSPVDKVTLVIDQDVDDNAFNDIKLIILYANQFDLDLDLNLFVVKE